MSKNKTMIINCEEALEICNKSQYNEASGYEKMKLKLHIMFCKICRTHTSKNGKLTKLCSEAKFKTMDPEKKEAIKKELETHH